MLHYTDTGKGTPIVLLHGFCEDSTLWDYHVDFLSQSFRVICIDLPGFGKNPALENETSIEKIAEEIRNTILSLELTKHIMIGHSLGGYITLAYAELYPQDLLGIGLFHSTAFADSEEKKINRNKAIDFITEHGVAVFAKNFISPLFNPSVRDNFTSEIAELVKIVANTPLSTVINVTKAMRDRKSKIDILKELNTPVLYIIGKSDTSVPLEMSLAQCHLPKNSTVHLYEKTGHMGMIERKVETALAMLGFCSLCVATGSNLIY